VTSGGTVVTGHDGSAAPRRRNLVRAVLFGAALFAVAGAMLLWYAASDDLPRSASTALLESIMPAYDVQEVHVPGFAVSTLSFHVESEGSGSRVTTITRVRTTDPDSRRAFLRYWRVISTGSAVLRRTWLRAVKARAER
jgi:hypothetical protein